MKKTVPHIDTEFRDLLPHSRPEERALLQESIKREGLRDPIVVWAETGAILDGNNRNEICDALKLKPTFRKVSLKDRAAAELWIITNQLGRRNLHPNHYAYFEGQRFERTKGKRGGDKKSKPHSAALNGKTAKRIASESGRSEDTVERNGAFARGVDLIESVKPGSRAQILSGESQLTKGQIERVAKLAKKEPEKLKAHVEEVTEGKREPTQADKDAAILRSYERVSAILRAGKSAKEVAVSLANVLRREAGDSPEVLKPSVESFRADAKFLNSIADELEHMIRKPK